MVQGNTKQAAKRLSHIDGLRGFAALIVVVMHGWGVAAELRLPSHLVDLEIYEWLLTFDVGRIGVVAFFCISGYLIPFTMNGTRALGLLSFAIRRSSRILPAYLISIPLTMLAAWLAEGSVYDSRTILLNIIMIPRLLGSASISGVYWTLEIEVLFYSVCAGLFFVGAIKKPAWLLSVSTVGFLAYLGLPTLTRHFFPYLLQIEQEHLGFIRLSAFYLSIMSLAAVFRLYCEGMLQNRVHVALLAFAALVLVGMLPAYFGLKAINSGSTPNTRLYIATSIGILLFLSALFARPFFARFEPLGRISYSLYLFHPISFMLAIAAIKAGYLSFSGSASGLLFVIATGCCSILSATICYQLVERPGIRAGRALSNLKSQKATASASITV